MLVVSLTLLFHAVWVPPPRLDTMPPTLYIPCVNDRYRIMEIDD